MIYRLDGDGPLYQQLYRSIRDAILEGKLAPGSRLESTRSLARDARVSRNVAIGAYDQLMAEGYIESRRGAGTFVCQALPEETLQVGEAHGSTGPSSTSALPISMSAWSERLEASARHRRLSWAVRRPTPRIEFRYGSPNYGDFPHTVWNRILQQRQASATIHQLDYGPPEGEPRLREALARYLHQARGVNCNPDQVVVVNGSQQGLDLITRVLLDPGDTVVLEEPHYAGVRWILEALGVEIKSIAVDEEGVNVDQLQNEVAEARLAIVTPSHQFPMGGVMPLARRKDLLNWAHEAGAMILEDDYDSEFRFDGLPHEALQCLDREGRVLYSGTFSKVMFPSLRLGYLVLPAPLVEPLVRAKAAMDTGSATLQQLALAEFLSEGHFERHLRRMRSRHAKRREVLLEAITEKLGTRVQVFGSNAGLHVLVRFRNLPGERTRNLIEAARKRGVGIHSATPFYRTPPAECELILGYGALQDRDIREGVAQLASALDETQMSGGHTVT